MTAELLDEGPEDGETVVIAWLWDLLDEGHVANTRRSGGPLPFILVHQIDGKECLEESTLDALVSVHVLTHKAAGEPESRDQTDAMHRRMLLLGRELPDVPLADGRCASIESVSVFKHPRREPYGDDQILRRIGRYKIGLSYVEAQ